MNLRKILIIGIIISLLLTALYTVLRVLVNRGKIEETVFWSNFKTWGLVLVIVCFVAILVTFLVNKYIDPKKKNGEALKQPVSSHRTVELWREQFVIHSKIPSIYYQNKLKPIDQDDLIISNEQVGFEKITGSRFIKFEALARKGERTGINTVMLRTDLGEEWIKENWNSHIFSGSIELHQLDKNLVIASPQDENIRTSLYLQELREEGAKEMEIKRLQQQMMIKENQQTELQLTEEQKEIWEESKAINNIEKMNKIGGKKK